ncbi:MAG: bifunctional hydroxymethylpyrimidine kinase/phosphomethylpyrimidine kinase [Firmicutes bacterium]|nr:bifunctional hydroxymethylpyrimidine kinase/phosphomethylpyrimidine kinase [Bacillota bacterium]
MPWKTVLTIAGSDSGGGAGIQADLKTFAVTGVHGASAVTALTAQNTLGVQGVQAVPAEFVRAQLQAVFEDLAVHAVKTGMLWDAATVRVVADELNRRPPVPLVVDPVMVAKGGASLLQAEAVEAMRNDLLPLCTVVTPNAEEASVLAGMEVRDLAAAGEAAQRIRALGPRAVVVKGGHLEGEPTDLLCDDQGVITFPGRRIMTHRTHGSGCTFAAALASFLAQGLPLRESVGRAKKLVTWAIAHALPVGRGHGPVNPAAWFAWGMPS